MATKPVSLKELRDAVNAFEKYGTITKAATALGIPRTTLHSRLELAKRPEQEVSYGDVSTEGIDVKLSETEGIIMMRSQSKKTVQEVLEEAEVDMAMWKVSSSEVSKHDGMAKLKQPDGTERMAVCELWRVFVKLKPTNALEPQSIIPELIKQMQKASPKLPKLPSVRIARKGDRYMAEGCVFDPHFGKLAWAPETGEDYDLKIAKHRVKGAITLMAERIQQYPIEKILLPIGNDLIHVSNQQGTTEKGTSQDTDGRTKKMYLEAFEVFTWGIDLLMQIAPVEIIEVDGNHDPLLTFTLCHAISERYHATDRVSVNICPMDRKYVAYGNLVLGFTHGNRPKNLGRLPDLMANEAPIALTPEVYARAKYKEWHVGHFHKYKEDKFNAGDTFGGTKVRVIQSLCGTDAWHFGEGYAHTPKEADLFIWHPEHGLEHYFPIRPSLIP